MKPFIKRKDIAVKQAYYTKIMLRSKALTRRRKSNSLHIDGAGVAAAEKCDLAHSFRAVLDTQGEYNISLGVVFCFKSA